MYTYPLNRPFQRRHTEPNIFAFSNNTNTTEPRNKAEEIAHIDAEIAHIEDNIVLLVRRRSFLQRKRNTYSPAASLPPELLALIFDYACLPSSDDAWKDLFMLQRQGAHGTTNLGMGLGTGAVTPLFLGAVCSTWRDIAFGTSRLWDAVNIRLNDKHAQQQARLLRQWLTRAGNRPLSIRVVEDETHTHRSDEEEEEHSEGGEDDERWNIDVTSRAVIDVLTSFSTQWHTLDLFVLPSSWKGVLSKVRHALPQLTNLTLRVADLSTTLARVDAFAYAPALRSVSLAGYSSSDVRLPYTQLERFDAEYFTVSECLDALRRCPSLRRSQFHQVDGLGIVEPAPNTTISLSVRHEQLQALELVLDGKREMYALLDILRLPALTELVLSLSDVEPLLGGVMSFLWRSGCMRTLRHLHLVGETPGDEELVRALKEMRGLEVLMLINPDSEEGELGDRFLEAMDPRKSRREDGSMACLVPRLRKFEYQGGVSFNPHKLVKFLVQRWKPESTYEAYQSKLSSTASHRFLQSLVPMDVDLEHEDLFLPHVSALESVILTTAKKTQFDSDDADTVRRLIEDGMHLEFVKDVNADGPGW